MRQQIIQLDDEGKKIVARQVRFFAQQLQIILEGVRTALDRGQSQCCGLALYRVYLPEQSVQLLAECGLLARRLAQHRVDHLHGGVGVVQEGSKLLRIDVQNAQQGIDLRLRLILRRLQFAGEIHAGADVRYRHQDVRDLAVHADTMEFEL